MKPSEHFGEVTLPRRRGPAPCTPPLLPQGRAEGSGTWGPQLGWDISQDLRTRPPEVMGSQGSRSIRGCATSRLPFGIQGRRLRGRRPSGPRDAAQTSDEVAPRRGAGQPPPDSAGHRWGAGSPTREPPRLGPSDLFGNRLPSWHWVPPARLHRHPSSALGPPEMALLPFPPGASRRVSRPSQELPSPSCVPGAGVLLQATRPSPGLPERPEAFLVVVTTVAAGI